MDEIRDEVRAKCEGEADFLHATQAVMESLQPLLERATRDERREYLTSLRVMMEPERVIMFRVVWEDDQGRMRVNRGYRVQYCSALGPYKGGLRFNPGVNLSVLKFLGFEQTLKNALTGQMLGGGKGGSDFDPHGCSEGEVRRFCQRFMMEMARHMGPDTDVPAGDMGVGQREIGWLFGQYRRLANAYLPALTGKGVGWGGIALRPEATGRGVVYMAECLLPSLEGVKCVVSGAGNVALHCADSLRGKGAVVLAVSDSHGVLVKQAGFTARDIATLLAVKLEQRGALEQVTLDGAEYCPDRTVWELVGQHRALGRVDAAFPCAVQNEVARADAQRLADAGCRALLEGANKPCTPDAVALLRERGVQFVPGKAANAGGVTVSGLEMQQGRTMSRWTEAEVDAELKRVMRSIYEQVQRGAEKAGKPGDLQVGADVAAFLRVHAALKAQGYV